MNPLTWSRPVQIVAIAGAVLLVYLVLSAFGGILWARHVAGKALQGIARTISDYDAVEADAAKKDEAIKALAAETAKLAQQAAAEHDARVTMQQHNAQLTAEVVSSRQQLDALRRQAEAMPAITTLDGAAAAINKAIGK